MYFNRSNFLGTEFHIYDIGDNPKKARMMESIRKELGVVTYVNKYFFFFYLLFF